jgi:hypothetical protein
MFCCDVLPLTYINFSVFENEPCASEDEYSEPIKEFMFSEYVAQFWGGYVQGERESDQNVLRSLNKFFKSPPRLAAIRQIQKEAEPMNWPSPLERVDSATRYCAGWLV